MKVVYIRVKKDAAALPAPWVLNKETRTSKIYSRVMPDQAADQDMGQGAAAAAPAAALDDQIMNELTALLGANAFMIGAQEVANQQQAEQLIAAVGAGVQSEEDALAAQMGSMKVGGGRRRTAVKRRRKNKTRRVRR